MVSTGAAFATRDQLDEWRVTCGWCTHIAAAQSLDDLQPALDILDWAATHALPSGVMAEQVHPYTNTPLSVSPLTWSHATLVATVQQYLAKRPEMVRCPACGQPLHESEVSEHLDIKY